MRCELRRALEDGSLLCRIEGRGKFWNREGSLAGQQDHLVEDFEFALAQLVVSPVAGKALLHQVTEWMHSPLEFEVPLVSFPSQRATLRIAPHPEMISTLERPVAQFEYSTRRLHLNLLFVVDQSCLAILRDELLPWVAREP